jgi:hypothetical protein
MTIKFDKERMDILSQGIHDNQVEEERQIHRGQKIRSVKYTGQSN